MIQPPFLYWTEWRNLFRVLYGAKRVPLVRFV